MELCDFGSSLSVSQIPGQPGIEFPEILLLLSVHGFMYMWCVRLRAQSLVLSRAAVP